MPRNSGRLVKGGAGDEDDPSKEKFGDRLRFISLIEGLETICNRQNIADKKKDLQKMIDGARIIFQNLYHTLDSEACDGDSVYPVMRILLTKRDERGAYGLKGPTLGRLLGEVLAVGAKEKAQLKNFRNPNAATEDTGNVPAMIFKMMNERLSSNPPSKMSITFINRALDRMAKAGDQSVQKGILEDLLIKQRICPLEGKWLCKLLLKDLNLGVGIDQILKHFHKDAYAFHKEGRTIRDICQMCNNPRERASSELGKIELFRFVKHMLCQRITTLNVFSTSDEMELEEDQNKGNAVPRQRVKFTRMDPPFVVETKWDGERAEIHYEAATGQFMYFSKSGLDWTDKFVDRFFPLFKRRIVGGVRSFIVDGEMMAWDKETKLFVQKGQETDVKHLTKKDSRYAAVFVAFDIIFLNGESLVEKNLIERKALLRQTLTRGEGCVEIPQEEIVHTKTEVENLFNKAIDNLEEGLIVKSPDSKYQPGFRGSPWRKVKPEFINSSTVEDMDLLVLGTYYTDSSRAGGKISHFLVGLVDKPGQNETFVALARIGSGYLRQPEMVDFVDKLKPHLKKETPFPNVQYGAGKRPDQYINPRLSMVVQVKASEIVQSSSFAANYTLRFPRLVCPREDKRYNQVMTVKEFHELRESCSGKLARRTDGKRGAPARKMPTRSRHSDSEEEGSNDDNPAELVEDEDTNYLPPNKQNKMEIETTVTPKKKQTETVTKNIFDSKTFCVYGSPSWKTETSNQIRNYGGKVNENPSSRNEEEEFFIVGEKLTHMKVEQAICLGKYDVLKREWLNNCISKGRLLQFSPKDFFYCTEKMEEAFGEDYDKNGDSYVEPVTLQEAKTMVQSLIETTNLTKIDASFARMEVEKELFKNKPSVHTKFNFFKGITVAFRGETDPALAGMIEFYGGKTVAAEGSSEDITHVIVKDPLSPKKKKQLSAFMVKPEWVKDCIKERKVLDDPEYWADCSV